MAHSPHLSLLIETWNSTSQDRPQCEPYEKFRHIVVWCYHCFGMNFQEVNTNSESKLHATNSNRDQAHAMIAFLANINNEEWFFDIGATHHLSQTTTPLEKIESYNGNDKVTIRNGTQLPILHTSIKNFSISF